MGSTVLLRAREEEVKDECKVGLDSRKVNKRCWLFIAKAEMVLRDALLSLVLIR